MEWYIYLNERHCRPAAWGCPLLDCNEQCSTFPGLRTHLKECHYLKTNTRQYTCPSCQKNVRIPSKGRGEKTMLKIRRSLDNILGNPSTSAQSSSPGSSLPSPLLFNASPSHERDQVLPLSHSYGSSEVNAQPINLFGQHNRAFPMLPLDTQFSSASTYANGPYSSNSCPSSTTTNSSFGSGPCSAFSSQGISSAISLPAQPTWCSSNLQCIQTPIFNTSNLSPSVSTSQPPCNLQHLGDLRYGPTMPACELSDENLLQETANTEGMASFLLGNSDTSTNYSQVERELQDEVRSFLDQWTQQEEFSWETPESVINSQGAGGFALEVAGSAYPAPDSFSPSSSDVTMADSPPTSEDSPPAAVSLIPKCKFCQWEPDTSVKRSLKKLAAAVEKHITRNHRSKDSQCPICYQVFKNRPDNVKPHVARKHPERLASLYPTRAVPEGPQGEKTSALVRTGTRRRASMPQSASLASPTRGKRLPFKRG